MRGGGKRDEEATRAAGFLDTRSYVRLNGKWLLFGVDVAMQRERIWKRDNRRCVECGLLLDIYAPILARNAMHRSHEIPRSKGRDDRDVNIKSRCPECHRKRDLHGCPGHF